MKFLEANTPPLLIDSRVLPNFLDKKLCKIITDGGNEVSVQTLEVMYKTLDRITAESYLKDDLKGFFLKPITEVYNHLKLLELIDSGLNPYSFATLIVLFEQSVKKERKKLDNNFNTLSKNIILDIISEEILKSFKLFLKQYLNLDSNLEHYILLAKIKNLILNKKLIEPVNILFKIINLLGFDKIKDIKVVREGVIDLINLPDQRYTKLFLVYINIFIKKTKLEENLFDSFIEKVLKPVLFEVFKQYNHEFLLDYKEKIKEVKMVLNAFSKIYKGIYGKDIYTVDIINTFLQITELKKSFNISKAELVNKFIKT